MPVNGRLILSPEGRKFKEIVQRYGLSKFHKIKEFKKSLLPNDHLEIETCFVFHKPRLISKKNELKKLDCSNRLKLAHDAIADFLEHDDKFFVSGKFSKVYCEHEKDQQVIIKIKKTSIQSLEQYQSLAIAWLKIKNHIVLDKELYLFDTGYEIIDLAEVFNSQKSWKQIETFAAEAKKEHKDIAQGMAFIIGFLAYIDCIQEVDSHKIVSTEKHWQIISPWWQTVLK